MSIGCQGEPLLSVYSAVGTDRLVSRRGSQADRVVNALKSTTGQTVDPVDNMQNSSLCNGNCH